MARKKLLCNKRVVKWCRLYQRGTSELALQYPICPKLTTNIDWCVHSKTKTKIKNNVMTSESHADWRSWSLIGMYANELITQTIKDAEKNGWVASIDREVIHSMLGAGQQDCLVNINSRFIVFVVKLLRPRDCMFHIYRPQVSKLRNMPFTSVCGWFVVCLECAAIYMPMSSHANMTRHTYVKEINIC